ncbi:hypothetical protein BY996DRAFT_6411682 [Phakopsora pachyrhizi]|nr:hypothetical protein BY996DRAFT_6411682 [Phakopsora pachyrhizi]
MYMLTPLACIRSKFHGLFIATTVVVRLDFLVRQPAMCHCFTYKELTRFLARQIEQAQKPIQSGCYNFFMEKSRCVMEKDGNACQAKVTEGVVQQASFLILFFCSYSELSASLNSFNFYLFTFKIKKSLLQPAHSFQGYLYQHPAQKQAKLQKDVKGFQSKSPFTNQNLAGAPSINQANLAPALKSNLQNVPSNKSKSDNNGLSNELRNQASAVGSSNDKAAGKPFNQLAQPSSPSSNGFNSLICGEYNSETELGVCVWGGSRPSPDAKESGWLGVLLQRTGVSTPPLKAQVLDGCSFGTEEKGFGCSQLFLTRKTFMALNPSQEEIQAGYLNGSLTWDLSVTIFN